MVLQKHWALTLATLCLTSAQLRAEESDDKASFSVQIPGLAYTSVSAKTKAGDEGEVKSTASGVSTADMSEAYAYITSGKYLFYAYPFSDGASELGFGYMFNDQLEVGLGLGYNSLTEKADSKTTGEGNALTFAPYAALYTTIGPFDSEHIFTLTLGQGESKEFSTDPQTGESTSTKTTTSLTGFSYDLYLLQSLAKNFWLLHGLSLATESAEEKTAGQKTKISSTSWNINVVGLRVSI